MTTNADQVRQYDFDRYLCALLAPLDRRADLLTLYAFNVEVSRIRDSVQEPLLAMIRLQWWRDLIGALYDGTPPAPHPLSAALGSMIAAHDLPRAEFDTYFSQRELDFETEPLGDLADLFAYARATAGGIANLGSKILGATHDAGPQAAMLMGEAWGACGSMRAVPYHARFGVNFVPQSVRVETGLAQWDTPSPALNAAVSRILAAAEAKIAIARALRDQVPRAALPVLLAARLLDQDLRAFRNVDCDPYRMPLRANRVARQAKLMFYAWRGTY